MTKFGVSSTSFLVLAVSAYSIQYPSYYMGWLLNQSVTYAIIRGVLVCMLMAYMMNPELRTGFTKRIIGGLGLLLMAAGITALISPTLFGHLPGYYPLGDALIFLELGIWSKVATAELPVPYREPKPVRIPRFALSLALWVSLFKERLALQPRKFLHSQHA